MKRFLLLACLIGVLGGCAIVPIGYPVYEHGYGGYRGYAHRDDGYRWHDHGDARRWGYGDYRR